MQVMRRAALALCACLLCAQTPAQSLFGQSDDEFLPPDEAFILDIVRQGGGHYNAQWRIAEGYYLYDEKLGIRIESRDAIFEKPPGEVLSDPYFGEVEVHRRQLVLAFDATAKEAEISYQGCADAGLCYPPIIKRVSLDTGAPGGAAPAAGTGDPMRSAPAAPSSEQDRLAGYLEQSTLLIAVAVFFGLGVLLAFTPCVLPMVPILSSVITSSGGGRISARRAFALSSVYVLAMAATYSVVGVGVALSGRNFQIWFQHPAVIVPFAVVFVLLALSMFGLYELRLPAALQTRLAGAGGNRRGSVSGAAVMGFLSALIVSPCVTPPLIGALLFVAQTGDALTGGAALFSLALGMGLPLLAVGTSLGRLLPKPGPALNATKGAFGFILLGFAVWLLDRVMLSHVTMLFTGALVIAATVCVFRLLRGRSSPAQTALGTLNALVFCYGLLLAANASLGGTNWLHPWDYSFKTSAASYTSALALKRLHSLDEIEGEITRAADAGQPAMLVFYADWCVACHELEALTFSDAEVQRLLADTAKLEADVTEVNTQSELLLKQYNIYGPPAILFFDVKGREIEWARIVGFIDARAFTAHLQKVSATMTQVEFSMENSATMAQAEFSMENSAMMV